jgi:hypothetical protein
MGGLFGDQFPVVCDLFLCLSVHYFLLSRSGVRISGFACFFLDTAPFFSL